MLEDNARLSRGISGLVGPLIVALLMGGVALTAVTNDTTVNPDATKAVATTTATPVKSQRQLLLGINNPGGKSDRLLAIDPVSGTITEQAVPVGWRSERVEQNAIRIVDSGRSDGSSAVKLSDGNTTLLKTVGGQAYQEPVILGKLGDSQTAIMAQNDDRREVVSVSNDGQLTKLYNVPQNANPVQAGRDAVWFATYRQCGGIEDKPSGPSSLIRLAAGGVTTTVATDERVIVSAVAGPSDALAYQVDSGEMVVRSGNTRWTGEGKPLAWIDDHTLAFSKSTQLYRLDLPAGTVTNLGQLPGIPVIGKITTTSP